MQATDDQWTQDFTSLCWSFNEVYITTSLLGVPSETRSIPDHSETQQGSEIIFSSHNYFIYAACKSRFLERFMSLIIFRGSYVLPFVKIAYMTLSSLQAITINDCIFFKGFSCLVV